MDPIETYRGLGASMTGAAELQLNCTQIRRAKHVDPKAFELLECQNKER
jgi:hypothetical protein